MDQIKMNNAHEHIAKLLHETFGFETEYARTSIDAAWNLYRIGNFNPLLKPRFYATEQTPEPESETQDGAPVRQS